MQTSVKDRLGNRPEKKNPWLKAWNQGTSKTTGTTYKIGSDAGCSRKGRLKLEMTKKKATMTPITQNSSLRRDGEMTPQPLGSLVEANRYFLLTPVLTILYFEFPILVKILNKSMVCSSVAGNLKSYTTVRQHEKEGR